MTLEWGAVCRPKQGQQVSGDVYMVEPVGDSFMIAVVDGLGGGEEAARAANLAVAAFRRHRTMPLQDLIKIAHADLHATRGAVVGLLKIEPQTRYINYVGVGNIGIYAYSQRSIKPISKNGILGFRLPSLLELRYEYDAGDTFILYSDGISTQFTHTARLDSTRTPQQLAEQILGAFGKQNDDATVLVVKA